MTATQTSYMTYEDAKEYLKGKMKEYLENEIGVDTRNNFNCILGTHEDNNPSMSFDRKRNKVHCFSCREDMDIFELVGVIEGLKDFKEQFDYLADIFNVDVIKSPTKTSKATNPIKEKIRTERIAHTKHTERTEQTKKNEYTELYKNWHANLKNCNYLTERGISSTIQKKKYIGYAPDFLDYKTNTTYKALIIPTSKNTYVVRNIDKEKAKDYPRYKKIGGSEIYNNKREYYEDESKTPIIIAEGEIDTLSFLEVGVHAVGLGSTSNVEKLCKIIKANTTAETCPPLIICLDNDEAGKKATAEFIKNFKGTGYTIINGSEGDLDNGNPIYMNYKDANEALVNSRAKFIENVRIYTELATTRLNARKDSYIKNTTAMGCLYEFYEGIKSGASTKFIPTGYTELDKILDGGITEGLYVVGAISSLGKTTFTLQMADQIAKYGNDVLIFSLEMAKRELIAKSLSRITYMYGDTELAKTARGITTSAKYDKYSKEELETIDNAVKEYSTYAQNVYIVEGIGEVTVSKIKEAVAQHIELTKRTPVVIVDYIQIVAPESDRQSEKQVIDHAVLELKRLSRDCKTPVIAISSFNRASYKLEASMASFKESGALEYGSDVLIGLQLEGTGSSNFDEMRQKGVSNDVTVPRRIELKILKNRNGRTGDTINYNFYSAFNFFEERETGWDCIKTTTGNTEAVKRYELEDDFYEDSEEYDTCDLD